MPLRFFRTLRGGKSDALHFYGELRSVAEYVVPVCGGESDALHFYGELRSVAEYEVPELKRQAKKRRAKERSRCSLCSMCGKLRSVAA